MPVDLFSQPRQITDSIIRKMTLYGFMNFRQSAKQSFDASEKVKALFSMEAPKKNGLFGPVAKDPFTLWFNYSNKELGVKFFKSLPSATEFTNKPYRNDIGSAKIRFKNCDAHVVGDFTDEFCRSVFEFVLRTDSSLNYICIDQAKCSPEALTQLLETGKVKQLRFFNVLPPDHMALEAIVKNSFFMLSYMDEADILLLKATNFKICFSTFSSDGANRILTELVNGERSCDYCEIKTLVILEKDIVFDGIEIFGEVSGGHRESVFIGTGTVYKVDISSKGIVIRKMSTAKAEKRCLKRKYVAN